ncbi:MAG: LPXTG cell wall anchor domain-containing protein [Eubacteriales bacterium]|nr:LPXTG cell wall anchor domain-containing protein [Christensenellaceae bacterium]MDY5719523.1 LPXTG cell wall anchor domain-containing protein [Eubacteriales bacterium]
MKKLFALVLSLALVVAFAVPALATGWATLDPAPVYKDITINVYGLETVANTSKVGYLYAELKTPYPVVKGTLLHFLVELYIPYTKLSPATKKLMEVKGLDLEIATSNMTIIDTADYDTKIPTSSGKINAKSTAIEDEFTKTDYAVDKTWAYEVWATANSDKETKVVATAGFYNKFVDDAGIKNHMMEIYNAKAEKVMTVYNNGDNFGVVNPDGDFVRFPVNSKGQIDTKGILVNDEWLITFGSQNKSEVDFWHITKNVWASADAATFKAVNAIYEDIFGFLGFKFAECDYMTAKHFEKFFGTIGEVSASYTWNAGMVVVNPATPDLPQTGDNASIVGFAMVVVAMVAAAVVTFKKVRA